MLAASAGETNEEQFKASHAEPELTLLRYLIVDQVLMIMHTAQYGNTFAKQKKAFLAIVFTQQSGENRCGRSDLKCVLVAIVHSR
jgi:hypothetical protein